MGPLDLNGRKVQNVYGLLVVLSHLDLHFGYTLEKKISMPLILSV